MTIGSAARPFWPCWPCWPWSPRANNCQQLQARVQPLQYQCTSWQGSPNACKARTEAQAAHAFAQTLEKARYQGIIFIGLISMSQCNCLARCANKPSQNKAEQSRAKLSQTASGSNEAHFLALARVFEPKIDRLNANPTGCCSVNRPDANCFGSQISSCII